MVWWVADAASEKSEKITAVHLVFSPEWLDSLSIRNKQTPHRYTNGSVLAGVLCYFLCVWVCLCGNIPSFFESVLLCRGWKMRVCVSAGTRVCVWVCVVTSEGDSLLQNMNEGLSNDHHFYSFLLPSGVHLSLSSARVCTYVTATITFLRPRNACPRIYWCGWASLVLHYKISVLTAMCVLPVVALCLFVCCKDNHYSIPDKWHAEIRQTGCK